MLTASHHITGAGLCVCELDLNSRAKAQGRGQAQDEDRRGYVGRVAQVWQHVLRGGAPVLAVLPARLPAASPAHATTLRLGRHTFGLV